MAKKNIILGIGLLLVIVLILKLFFTLLIARSRTTPATSVSDPFIQKQTRGWKVDADKATIYQFPVKVVGDIRIEDELFKVKVNPFESSKETFDLFIGSQQSKFNFGYCTFSEKGEITSDVTWTVVPIEHVIQEIKTGDTLLIRLTYPLNPVGDQVAYKEELLKRIASLEQKTPIDFIFPSSLCKTKQ